MVAKPHGGMTPREYNDAVTKLGWTAYSAGQHIGISLRMSHDYAAGKYAVSAPVAKLLRAMLRLREAGLSWDDV